MSPIPDVNITTPALLFPAISLLLLAYTNRFLTLANLIRDLHSRYKLSPDPITHRQLGSLRYRIRIIKWMQASGVASLLLCTLSMFAIYATWEVLGAIIFGAGLILMMISLVLSFREIQVSIDALEMRLSDIENL